jgi:hypothetical protein
MSLDYNLYTLIQDGHTNGGTIQKMTPENNADASLRRLKEKLFYFLG